MARPSSMIPSTYNFVVAALLLLLLLLATIATPTDKGFTVELIHRYSDRSPFYNENLAQSQLLKRLVELSRSRLQWLESTNLGANITAIRPLLAVNGLLYLVPVMIGSGQGKRTFLLVFDTGSSLTWTQCEPCVSCFEQRSERFNPGHSPTYRPLQHTDRLCDKPDGEGHCTFNVAYEDGSSAQGILSHDTFTFLSDSRNHYVTTSGVVFGCAHSATVSVHGNHMDGIMGMGITPVSFLTQQPRIIDGYFSYCLRSPGTGKAGFLRFGRNQVHLSRELEATPILPYQADGRYKLLLEGISINNRRLNLPPKTFARPGNHRGCIIDTGCAMSVLIKEAYDVVSHVLRREHFVHLHRVDGRSAYGHNLDLCYKIPNNYASVLPNMTLHFPFADYHIENEKLFAIDHEVSFFCWAMFRSDQYTVLGAYQQSNMRFVYNIQSRMLLFGPEDCAAELQH